MIITIPFNNSIVDAAMLNVSSFKATPTNCKMMIGHDLITVDSFKLPFPPRFSNFYP